MVSHSVVYFETGEGESCYFTYVSDYTKLQDVAYTVDAVVLYVSVAVEL